MTPITPYQNAVAAFGEDGALDLSLRLAAAVEEVSGCQKNKGFGESIGAYVQKVDRLPNIPSHIDIKLGLGVLFSVRVMVGNANYVIEIPTKDGIYTTPDHVGMIVAGMLAEIQSSTEVAA